MAKPHALVFDLGNVLLPIDLDKTFEAFALLSSRFDAAEIKQLTLQDKLWEGYESGLQSDAEFEAFLIDRLKLTCSTIEFQNAFNALLLTFDEAVCQYIKSLQSSYPLFLLSNTSKIHSDLFLHQSYPNYDLFDAFKRVHLSFEMGLVKPDVSIYQQLVNANHLQNHQIVFFDDNIHNIEAASKFGWQAILIDPKNSLQQIKQHIESLC